MSNILITKNGDKYNIDGYQLMDSDKLSLTKPTLENLLGVEVTFKDGSKGFFVQSEISNYSELTNVAPVEQTS